MESPSTAGSILGQGSALAALDALFPGFTSVRNATFLMFLAPYVYDAVKGVVKTRLISSVEISASDEIYTYVMRWVAAHSLSKNNHRLLASSSINSEDDDEEDGDPDLAEPASDNLADLRSNISLYNARPLHWTPAMGTHFLRYGGRFLTFTRSLEENNTQPFGRHIEKIVISCLGTDATVLKRLIYNARMEHLQQQRGRTSIYRAVKVYGDDLAWSKYMSKATRPMSTIALDESIKEGLIKDLQRYLDPRTKRWYATRGIPYRRGYLFSGPPGTGKTSLTLAAAGIMGLDIYMISLNSPLLSEDTLATLFRDLPRTCLVLLEDIDATNLTHKREVISVESKTPAGPKRVREREPVSLSGLLNVIDGVGAQEGRVLVMTSNHTENIDPALLRPGRVDFSVKFGLATSHMATQLFTQMYEDKAEEAEEEMRMSLKETEDLNSLAVEFGKKVPELTFSPAALQGFLLTHQDDPHGAVEAVEGWVEERAAQDKAAAKAKEEAKAIEDAPKAIEDTPKSEVNGEKKD
ncbi:hypothetical protein MRS44_012881 [Fusarium solani]|uniref:BCS1 N terminal-domain-containing protein n=1 Tax=Fusarium solani TaxID=169388 RepID=A0A9P9K1J8_FUSSL|nr:BCS1 N terminal-domain-containing protein [Fusarium solani]KAH7240585.1 BCS1 N terminal-domain-containing protein [Fusarium solani]KAJ3458772.1 hypothetical protein MRS44_012881 [Fusarium solani]KAJ4210827.1 hypothetical protein NW759_013129 [Fusarium solani]